MKDVDSDQLVFIRNRNHLTGSKASRFTERGQISNFEKSNVQR